MGENEHYVERMKAGIEGCKSKQMSILLGDFENIDLTAGGEDPTGRKMAEIYLSGFTRVFGIRKKVAELTGLVHLVDKSKLE